MLTFDEIIDSFSRTNPKKIIVSDHRRKLTYARLKFNGNNLANYLTKKKVKKKR